MRKAFGIVIGCILLCGLATAAMLAVPPPTPVTVTINGDMDTDGVDTPWFELSRSAGDTVQWANSTNSNCTLSFGKKKFLKQSEIDVPAKGQSIVLNASDAPAPKAGWPPNKVYKVYKYTVECGGVSFDPGGGMRP
jgi:hypothetical protein